MQNELLGWMKLIRYLILWFGSWWVINTSLTAFAQWSAMPPGIVLTIILAVVSLLVTRATVAYVERVFFGHSPMYDQRGQLGKRSTTTAPSSAQSSAWRTSTTTSIHYSDQCNCAECRDFRRLRDEYVARLHDDL